MREEETGVIAWVTKFYVWQCTSSAAKVYLPACRRNMQNFIHLMTELCKYHNLPYNSCLCGVWCECESLHVCVSMQNSLSESNIMQSKIHTHICGGRARAFTCEVFGFVQLLAYGFPLLSICVPHIYPDDKWDDS